MNAIEIHNLHKSYGNVEVLKGINLQVERGSLIALLGPNGAGKTTTVRILSTLLRFNSGTVKVFGHDVLREADAVRQRVSLTGQFASVDEELTGMENLVLVARLLGYSWSEARNRAQDLLIAFDLSDAGNRLVKQYSGGMRRRLDIAASIVVSPDLLFLDEPTTGLDPRSRRSIWGIIRGLRAAGTTVLLTTQYLEEADELADRIVIIDHGQIIADGTPDQLKTSIGSGVLNMRLKHKAQYQQARDIIMNIIQTPIQHQSDTDMLSVQLDDADLMMTAITALNQAGIGLAEFSLEQPSLDDVFLALTDQPVQQDTTKEIA